MADEKITAKDTELDDEKIEKPDLGEGGTGEQPPKKDDSQPVIEKLDDIVPVIPVRKSVQQHIIARQKDTIEKLRSKAGDGGTGELPDDREDDDLTPEARTAVRREVDGALSPILSTLRGKIDEDELSELYAQEPEAKKFDKQIRAYMGHKSWAEVPPGAIYHHIAFGNAEIIGSRKKRIADKEAGQNRGGGRQLRPQDSETGNIPSIEQQEAMTDDEFENLQHQVRTGKFTNK